MDIVYLHAKNIVGPISIVNFGLLKAVAALYGYPL